MTLEIIDPAVCYPEYPREIDKIQATLEELLKSMKKTEVKAIKITADLNAIQALIERLNALSDGAFGEYDITLEPDLTLLRDGQPCNAGCFDKSIISYLELRISELQRHRLYSRFMMMSFDILKPDDIDRIVHELEPLKALYALGFDPGTTLKLDLISDAPAWELLGRLLMDTPLIHVREDMSFTVEIPAALLVALEKYVHH
jgi:hypothetical protein